MPATVIVGAQWGDEGKGKLTDLLADKVDFVVRYQGGDNAGHTIVNGDQTVKLHAVPSGVLYPHITPVIGNGVVVNPRVLLDEIARLAEQGVDASRLRLSHNAHVIMPYHILLDRAAEEKLGTGLIGTTCKGIGPAYADKIGRTGIRVQDLLDEEFFRQRLATVLERKNELLAALYGIEPLSADEIAEEYLGYADRIRHFVEDTSLLLDRALAEGRQVILEGAQGTLLDIDHGTYPYVTSSSPCTGGAISGSGVSPFAVKSVIGIVKAYVTRVGSGPFPTELEDEAGALMRERGIEFGTTTGRSRRCGWFDAVLLRYAVRVNAISSVALTKLDVLSSFPTLKLCVGYRFEGKVYEEMPDSTRAFENAEPIYEEVEGWAEDISSARVYSDLPAKARSYVERIESLTGVSVDVVSVGPGRGQTIARREVLPAS